MEEQKQYTRFPDPFISPEEKNDKWCMENARAIYREYRRNGLAVGFNANSQYLLCRRYAKGKQSEEQYRQRLDVKDKNNESYVNLDWRIVPFMVKYVSIVVGKIAERNYEITCDPIDPLAIDARKQFKSRLESQIRLQDFYKEIQAVTGIDYNEEMPEMISDLEDLEVYIQNNYKNQLGADLEQAIQVVFERNDWEQIRKSVIEDLAEINIGGVKVWMDNNGNPRIRRVEPEFLITSYCKNEDFSDIQYVGEVRYLTAQEIQQESGNKFTTKQLQDMFEKGRYEFHGGGRVRGENAMMNDDVRLEVIDCEWFSIDKYKFEKKQNAFGNSRMYEKNLAYQNKQGREVVDVGYKVVYKCSWVVGTEYAYNCGLKNDMIRTKSNPVEAHLGYFLFCPNMKNGLYISLVEQLIPMADALQMAWLKIQDCIASAVKKGVSIDLDGLLEANVDFGGRKMDAKEILDFYFKKGIILYSGKDQQGNPNYKPIVELENGMAKDVMNFHSLLLAFLDMIRMVSGVNEVTDASTPSPEMLVGNAQMAYQATNLALYHLFHAEEKMLKGLVPALAELIMDSEKYYGTVFTEALGENTQRFISEHSDKSIHEYGYKINRLPDMQERQTFEIMLQESLKNREIELEDYYAIRGIQNLKQAQTVLVIRKKKRMKIAQQQELERINQNVQSQMQSAQQANELRMQEIQAESEAKLQQIQLEKALEMEKLKLEYKLKESLARIEGGIKTEIAEIQNEGKLATAEMQQESAMVSAQMNKDKPKAKPSK